MKNGQPYSPVIVTDDALCIDYRGKISRLSKDALFSPDSKNVILFINPHDLTEDGVRKVVAQHRETWVHRFLGLQYIPPGLKFSEQYHDVSFNSDHGLQFTPNQVPVKPEDTRVDAKSGKRYVSLQHVHDQVFEATYKYADSVYREIEDNPKKFIRAVKRAMLNTPELSGKAGIPDKFVPPSIMPGAQNTSTSKVGIEHTEALQKAIANTLSPRLARYSKAAGVPVWITEDLEADNKQAHRLPFASEKPRQAKAMEKDRIYESTVNNIIKANDKARARITIEGITDEEEQAKIIEQAEKAAIIRAYNKKEEWKRNRREYEASRRWITQESTDTHGVIYSQVLQDSISRVMSYIAINPCAAGEGAIIGEEIEHQLNGSAGYNNSQWKSAVLTDMKSPAAVEFMIRYSSKDTHFKHTTPQASWMNYYGRENLADETVQELNYIYHHLKDKEGLSNQQAIVKIKESMPQCGALFQSYKIAEHRMFQKVARHEAYVADMQENWTKKPLSSTRRVVNDSLSWLASVATPTQQRAASFIAIMEERNAPEAKRSR